MDEKPGCDRDSVFYAFFSCQCKGIKFYELKDVVLDFGHHVSLHRKTRMIATPWWRLRSLANSN